uniref:Acetoacetate decarboxylase n=1 Tax=Mycena chlorophos TaxID=658473 RepID=A0ABQ0L2J5_MYCCL|nr:predicted protein [Mycena chlorophos]
MPAVHSTLNPVPIRLEPVVLEGRDPRLPQLYRVYNHPLAMCLADGKRGRVYLYFQDTSPEGLAKTWGFEQTLETPTGSPAYLKTIGLLQLESGDTVFSRALGSTDPFTDVPMVWVVGRELLTPQGRLAYRLARDDMLGDGRDHTLERPTLKVVNNEPTLVGGVAFERSGIAKSVRGARAYTLGTSYEVPRNAVAPSAGFKVSNTDAHTAAARKQTFIEASTTIAMECMELGPQPVVTALRTAADLHNTPVYAIDGNYAYGTT